MSCYGVTLSSRMEEPVRLYQVSGDRGSMFLFLANDSKNNLMFFMFQ